MIHPDFTVVEWRWQRKLTPIAQRLRRTTDTHQEVKDYYVKIDGSWVPAGDETHSWTDEEMFAMEGTVTVVAVPLALRDALAP